MITLLSVVPLVREVGFFPVCLYSLALSWGFPVLLLTRYFLVWLMPVSGLRFWPE